MRACNASCQLAAPLNVREQRRNQTEVLESKMPKEAQTRVENVFKRRNFIWTNHDTRVGKLSHDIRDYYNQRGIKLIITFNLER